MHFQVLKSLRDQLNVSLRVAHSIPILDTLLSAPAPPSRPPLKPQRDDASLPGNTGSRRRLIQTDRPPVVEVVGAAPGSGRTRLLYEVAAQCLLPPDGPDSRNAPSLAVAGSVIWIDAGSRFSLSAFISTMSRTATSSAHPLSTTDPETLQQLQSILGRLHVFRPQSADALVATIQGLKSQLSTLDSQFSQSCPLNAIIISDISAFYWQERAEDEDAQMESNNLQGAEQQQRGMLQRWRVMVAALRELQARFGCIVALSNVALFAPRRGSDGPVVKPHLPGIWNGFVTVRALLWKEPGRKIRRGMSVEEALLEARARQQQGTTVTSAGRMAWVERVEMGQSTGVDESRPRGTVMLDV